MSSATEVTHFRPRARYIIGWKSLKISLDLHSLQLLGYQLFFLFILGVRKRLSKIQGMEFSLSAESTWNILIWFFARRYAIQLTGHRVISQFCTINQHQITTISLGFQTHCFRRYSDPQKTPKPNTWVFGSLAHRIHSMYGIFTD